MPFTKDPLGGVSGPQGSPRHQGLPGFALVPSTLPGCGSWGGRVAQRLGDGVLSFLMEPCQESIEDKDSEELKKNRHLDRKEVGDWDSKEQSAFQIMKG